MSLCSAAPEGFEYLNVEYQYLKRDYKKGPYSPEGSVVIGQQLFQTKRGGIQIEYKEVFYNNDGELLIQVAQRDGWMPQSRETVKSGPAPGERVAGPGSRGANNLLVLPLA